MPSSTRSTPGAPATASSRAPRGRPRSAEVDAAVRRATLHLLRDRGYAATSIEQVAAAAGVAKTAIYRRWGSKAELVFAVAVHGEQIAAPADSGSLRGDLRALCARVLQLLDEPVARAALPGLLADLRGDPALAARFHETFVEPERALLAELLTRAAARGESLPAIDATSAAAELHAQLLGTVFAWLHLIDEPPPSDLAERLAGALVAGLRDRGGRP